MMERSRCKRSTTGPMLFSAAAAILMVANWAADGLAKAPRLGFDMPLAIACRDVTSEAFTADHPDERLIRADFEITALVTDGDAADLVEFEFRFVGRGQRLRVFDYEPRTTLASDYAGGLQFEERTETSKSAGLAASGGWDHVVKATGSGDIGSKTTNVKRYELVAPQQPIATSGTILSGYGVSVKLRPSRATTLEGAKPFSVTWRVPRSWRADVLDVVCLADGIDRGVVKPLDERVQAGSATFRVALHMVGDPAARRAGEELILADRHLRRVAAANEDDIHRRSYPTVLHEIGGLLDVVKPRISDRWLDELVAAAPASLAAPTYRRLPPPVRAAAADYVAAHRRFRATVSRTR